LSERSLIDLFHKIKKILPQTQQLITFEVDTSLNKAIEIMLKNSINQVPVLEGEKVIGVFSYRSFSRTFYSYPEILKSHEDLTVADFLEDLEFSRITDELTKVIKEFNDKDAVLVGRPDNLQGIVTTIDALEYFMNIANPFIMIGEIELAIREVIRISIESEKMTECLERCLVDKYGEQVPTRLEDLTLNDLVLIIRRYDTYDYFKDIFGANYTLTSTRLKRIPDLRNSVFHFKHALTVEEYDEIKNTREWILKKINIYEAKREIE